MQQLIEQGVRSVILTSGTLSPLKPFISELGIPIDVQLENPHIVTGKQVCVGVLAQGPDGHPLNSSFNTRFFAIFIFSLNLSGRKNPIKLIFSLVLEMIRNISLLLDKQFITLVF